MKSMLNNNLPLVTSGKQYTFCIMVSFNYTKIPSMSVNVLISSCNHWSVTDFSSWGGEGYLHCDINDNIWIWDAREPLAIIENALFIEKSQCKGLATIPGPNASRAAHMV